jgi:hypothetical protein
MVTRMVKLCMAPYRAPYPDTLYLLSLQFLSSVMLTIVTAYLYSTWKLHSDTCKDVIRERSMGVGIKQ